jgi:hypothetical protein
MTTEGLAIELAGGSQPPALAQILAFCDRTLAEYGRRRHLFAWLRAPGAGPEEWLEVAAYYPGNKLVVVWHEQPGPNDGVYAELIPAHGLRLLSLEPDSIDRGDPEAALQRLIAELGPTPPRATERVAHEDASPRAAWTLSPPPEPHPRVPQRATQDQHTVTEQTMLGALLGVTLAAVLIAEVYLGVGVIGLDAGRIVLAFGLALDVCARALGTIAARRAGEADAAWGSAIVGSPVVAAFAVFGRDGPVTVDPAPLAGLISVIACVIVALGVLAAAL